MHTKFFGAEAAASSSGTTVRKLFDKVGETAPVAPDVDVPLVVDDDSAVITLKLPSG